MATFDFQTNNRNMRVINKFLWLLCAWLIIQTASAQEGWKDCVKVEQIKYLTQRAYGEDFSVRDYSGDSLLVGVEMISFVLSADETTVDIRKQLEVPSDAKAVFTLTDMYGKKWSVQELDVTFFLKKAKLSTNTSKTFVQYHHFSQGGQFACCLRIDVLDYEWNDTVTVYSSPCVRIDGDKAVKIGGILDNMVYFDTGFPYNTSSLKENEYAKAVLYRINNDETETELMSKQIDLPFKNAEKPLLAVIDSIPVKIEKPDLGAYKLQVESNCNLLANREILIYVQDTLRATVELDKVTYSLGDDSHATLHVTMNYGFPFISVGEPDEKPTIRMQVSITSSSGIIEHLRDSLLLVSDTLETQELDYKGDMAINLSNIDKTGLVAEGTACELAFKIVFNGRSQFEKVLPLTIKLSSTAIEAVETKSVDELYATFDLRGIRVDRDRKRPGIYIRNGKKTFIK